MGAYSIVEEGCDVGDNTEIGNYVLLKRNTKIGTGVYIDSYVKSSGNNRIGNNVTLRYNATIARDVEIEDDVFISPNVMTIYVEHTGEMKGGIVIGKGAFIGTNVVIGAGLKIGPGVTIGAMALVARDCIDPGIYVGIPARKRIKDVHPSAVIFSGMELGKNIRIGAGTIVGAHPTVFRKEGKEKVRVRKKSDFGVVIKDNVDIGSLSTIVRGNTRDTLLKDNVVIGHLCNIAHDVVIEENSVVITGSVLSGYVEVGKHTYIGLSTDIRQRVKIGDHVYIGMGSLVLDDVPDYSFGYGRPLKVVGRTDELKIKGRLATQNIRWGVRRHI